MDDRAIQLLREAADHIDGVTGARQRVGSDSGELVDRIDTFLSSRPAREEVSGERGPCQVCGRGEGHNLHDPFGDVWHQFKAAEPTGEEVERVALAMSPYARPGCPDLHVLARAAIAAMNPKPAEADGEAKAIIDELNACYLYGVSEKSDALAKRIIAHLSRGAEAVSDPCKFTDWRMKQLASAMPKEHPEAAKVVATFTEDGLGVRLKPAEWECMCGVKNPDGNTVCGFCDCERCFGDKGLREQVRPTSECLSAFDVISGATPATEKAVNPDTVAFVQEWMMSGDYEADQWHRDFAEAIDARAHPPATDVAGLREALYFYAKNENYDGGDVPGHIYVLDDHGRYAREALDLPEEGAHAPRHNLYRSQAEYEAIRDLQAAWREVRHSIVDLYNCPDHIGMGDILAIAAILRCNALPEEPSA